MKILSSPVVFARWRRRVTGKVVLVPTMGALHLGHESLIKLARRRAGKAGCVVVSVFVNPTQFGPNEDFARYPRPWASDRAKCEALGVDAVFRPEATDFYHPDHSVMVTEEQLADGLCGKSRPGHFNGVLTVVTKLFHVTQPQEAVFGEKDYQQLALIRRMVRDLDFPIRIIAGPTVREADGLALSSRNAYLTPEERAAAPGIRRALLAAQGRAKPNGRAHVLQRFLQRELERIPGARVEYAEVIDGETLEPRKVLLNPSVALVALRLGKTRLIDNIPLL